MSALRIIGALLAITELPFVMMIRHSLAGRISSDSVMLGLRLSDGRTAWGECLPRDYVTGEDTEGTFAVLAEAIKGWKGQCVPLDRGEFESGFWADALKALESTPSARSALESALLDAWGLATNKSVVDLLGPVQRSLVSYTGIIPADAPAVVAMVAQRTAAVGIATLKLKVGLDLERDIANVRLCRDAYEGPVDIRVDANCAWSVDEAARSIEALFSEGVVSFEEPLAAGEVEAYIELREHLPDGAKVIADESLCSLADAHKLIKARAVQGLNLKVSKLGGLLQTLAVVDAARQAGLTCQLGAHIGESSLMTAAGLAVAALTGDLVAHEGAYGTRLLEYDLVEEPLQFGPNGQLSVQAIMGAPGWSLAIDESRVEGAARLFKKLH